jgi:type II secretory pathway component PulL
VERLVLTGEAGSKELARAIEETLGVPCRLISWEKEAGLASARALSPEVLARVGACLGAGLSALNPFQTSFDLRREELMAGEGWRGLKRPALAAASAALVLGVAAYGDLALKVRREERRLEAAERQVRSVFDEVFPPGRRIVDPQSQLTARVQEQAQRLAFLTGSTGNGDGPLDVMAKVSRAVPSALKVRVDRLEVDDMGVSLEGETVSFEGVDRIKSGLMNEPGFERLEVKQARLAEGKQEVHFLMRIPFPASPAGKQR